MNNRKTILVSLEKVIEFLELDSQQLEENAPMLSEVNKTIQVLKRYQDDLRHTSFSEDELES